MALPTNAIIYTGDGYPPSQMEGGRALPIYPWLDHEYGPVGANDASLGLTFQIWSAEIIDEGTKIKIWAENIEPFILHEGINITNVSISFDINANLNCVFTENGSTKLYWYDTVAQETNIKEFDIHLNQAKLSLDDKYDTSGNSDLILAYVRDHQIYYRLQRNRYDVEYVLNSDRKVITLHKIGMGVNGRFQIIVHNSNEGIHLNKVNLIKQLTIAGRMRPNEHLYYPTDWSIVDKLLEEAYALYSSNMVTTKEYSTHAANLETALKNIWLIPDTSLLVWIKEYLRNFLTNSSVAKYFDKTVPNDLGMYPSQDKVNDWVREGIVLLNTMYGSGLCPKLPVFKIPKNSKTQLYALIGDISAMTLGLYTPETVNNLQSVIEAATLIYEDPAATEYNIIDAINALNDALKELEYSGIAWAGNILWANEILWAGE